MKIWTDESGSSERLKDYLLEIDQDENVSGIMVMACEANGLSETGIDQVLRGLVKPIGGGLFPGVVFGGKMHDKGSVVIAFTDPLKHFIVEDIHGDALDLSPVFDAMDFEAKTVIVNFDGLSSGVETFKDELFLNFGLKFNYIGGGAGALSFERKPYVISNKGILKDAAVIFFLDTPSGVGVAHGWSVASQAMKATEVDKNKIISLNWSPAFDVYQKTVEALSQKSFSENAFFDIAKGYPFGIYKMGADFVVRDPIGVHEDKGMICVGEMPENAFVHILTGDKQSLIEGAIQAKENALASYQLVHGPFDEKKPHLTLFIDCISRVLFLGDAFQEELDAVASQDMVGALTLGELANTGQAYLELYNKTSVVGLLGGK